MKAKDIRVGGVYVNKGAGRTLRRVVNIIDKDDPQYKALLGLGKPKWYSWNPRPKCPIVVYVVQKIANRQIVNGPKEYLYMQSFSQWAKSEVAFFHIGDLRGCDDQGE